MADLTPAQTLEQKLRAFIESCSPDEQAALFTMLYEEPEVLGFQAAPTFDLQSFLSNIMKKQADANMQVIKNLS